MSPDLEAVLRLQSIDDRLAALQKEIAALPKHIAEIEVRLDSHTKRLQADRAALAASQKKRKSLEDDAKTWEQKIAKLRDQMQQAKTNEQFKAFQNEISYAQGQIRSCEDQVLELMTSSEPLEANVSAAETALAAEKKIVDAEKESAVKKTEADQASLRSIQEERQAVAATIPQPTLNTYARARKRWQTSGVADATNGRCEKCHIALRPQHFQELRNSGQVMTCESCGRILYYNPPVSLEHELHQKV